MIGISSADFFLLTGDSMASFVSVDTFDKLDEELVENDGDFYKNATKQEISYQATKKKNNQDQHM